MADSDKTLKLQIEVDGEQAAAVTKTVAGEMERLTNTGKGLATAVPELTEAVKSYVITTEAEYLAVQKSYEAISAKIPVLRAAGKSTEELEAAQKNLDAALSTSAAINVANRLEHNKTTQAMYARIAAEGEARVAAGENANAHEELAKSGHLSSTAMREMIVISRELGRGDFSRLPGSISILAQQLGLMEAILSPIGIGLMGVGVAGYLVYQHFKSVNEQLEVMNANWKKFDDIIGGGEALGAQNEALEEMVGKTDAAAAGTERLADASKALTEATKTANAAVKEAAKMADEELKAQEAAALAKVKLQLATGEISPEEAQAREGSIKGQFQAARDFEADKAEKKKAAQVAEELAAQQGLLETAAAKKITMAGAVDSATVDESTKKHLWEAAKKDAADQGKFMQEHGPSLSPDEFSKEFAKERLLIHRAVQAGDVYDTSAKNAEKVKADVKANEQTYAESKKRVDDLQKQHDHLAPTGAANAEHRRRMEDFSREKNQAEGFTQLLQQRGTQHHQNAQHHDVTTHLNLKELAEATHKSNAQTTMILQSIVDGHRSFQTVMAQLEAQLAAQRGRGPGG